MGHPRPKKRTGEGPCAEDGPPPPFRTWQAPPDGLFDVIVPTLTAKQFVVVQLVCKDWSRSARYCLKDATPKRPDVDLSKLATLYPNLTQLNLSHVEGLSTHMLTPLRQLTALRELCLSNISMQHIHREALNAGAGDAGAPEALATAAVAPGAANEGGGAGGTATAGMTKATSVQSPQPPSQARMRPRSRGGAQIGSGKRAAGHDDKAWAPTGRSPGAGQQPQGRTAGPSSTKAAGSDVDREVTGGSLSVGDSPPTPQQPKLPGAEDEPTAACAASFVRAVGAGQGSGAGAAAALAAPRSPGSSPPLSPASRIFGGLGDVLVRLSKLQADLCPALTADAIACLPNLTDLTLDTLVAPEALVPLCRLRCLAVKKLANPEALERLSGLAALSINSDSSCASEFLPVCTRLPELQSLTFKTSSTRVLQQPDLLCWQGFSRLSSLDLRAPAECLKPGLPALAELGALRSLSLDLYCASEEELMVTVVAPPNLESLFVSSDRSRSGGVIDVQPNPRLRALRIRLYWTALNLVLPEGVSEPSPLPEPLSEDLDLDPRPAPAPGPAPGLGPGRRTSRPSPTPHPTSAPRRTPSQGGHAPAGPPPAAAPLHLVGRDEAAAAAGAGLDGADGAAGGPTGAMEVDVETRDRREAGHEEAAAADAGRACGRGLRRRREGGGSLGSGGGGDGGGARAGEAAATDWTERGPRWRVMGGGSGGGAAATAAAAPSSGGRGTAAAMVTGDSSGDESGGAGGSDGGSSGEEVGFHGAGPSATAVRVTGSRGRFEEAVDVEDKADVDPLRPVALPVAVGGAAAAGTGGGGEPHSSRRQITPLANRLGAAEGTPRPDRSRSGASACRDVGMGAAAAAAGVSTPVGSVAATSTPDMDLQELCLDACFFLLYGSLVPLLRQFPRLRKLTLDNSLALENGELAQLCALSGLRELSLSGLHLVTDAGLRALGRLPQLTSLRVKGLRKLSVHAAQAYMRQKPIVRRYEEISGSFLTSLSGLRDLRSLALKHLHTAGEGALAAGLGALTQLTRLEVKDVHSMSDKVLLALRGHNGLQDLSVLHCEAVTPRGRNAVVRALGQRVALDFEGCSLPDITRPCALPTASTQAQLIDDDQVSSSNQPRRSCQHSNQH